MIYKLLIKNNQYYGERPGETSEDVIGLPDEFRKFRFWWWYKNPLVKIYRYKNYKWCLVFNLPYRELSRWY